MVVNPHLQAAIDEARLGRSEGGIPIGSVLLRGGGDVRALGSIFGK